jgi:hypothetical protein
LDVADSSKSFTVKDFAVETEAGKGILAGHVFISVPEHILKSIDVYTSGERLYYRGDARYPGETIRLVNLSGQIVWESKLEDLENTWDINGLPRGIYAVEVTLKSGEGFAKKVFLGQ